MLSAVSVLIHKEIKALEAWASDGGKAYSKCLKKVKYLQLLSSKCLFFSIFPIINLWKFQFAYQPIDETILTNKGIGEGRCVCVGGGGGIAGAFARVCSFTNLFPILYLPSAFATVRQLRICPIPKFRKELYFRPHHRSLVFDLA